MSWAWPLDLHMYIESVIISLALQFLQGSREERKKVSHGREGGKWVDATHSRITNRDLQTLRE